MTTHQDESRTERELRAALADRAREIRPSSRLDAILDEAAAPEGVPGRSPWVVPLSVAAAALLVAAVVWATQPKPPSTLPAGPSTATTSGTASATPSPSPTSTPSSSPTATSTPSPSGSASAGPPSTVPTVLGIYWVGSNGGAEDRPGLVRDFWAPGGGASADLEERVTVAVRESMRRTGAWAGGDVVAVAVTDERVTLRLSRVAESLPSEQAARLAVSAVAWTAQAVVGRGDLPVRVTTADGGPILGRVASGTTVTRASTPPGDLCDIWVDSPAPGATLSASRAVTVRGQAVAFEANVEWQLLRGASVVKGGFTTASVGAPGRGAFTVDLGRLDPGTWTFRAFTTSAKDGTTLLAERDVTFTVR